MGKTTFILSILVLSLGISALDASVHQAQVQSGFATYSVALGTYMYVYDHVSAPTNGSGITTGAILNVSVSSVPSSVPISSYVDPITGNDTFSPNVSPFYQVFAPSPSLLLPEFFILPTFVQLDNFSQYNFAQIFPTWTGNGTYHVIDQNAYYGFTVGSTTFDFRYSALSGVLLSAVYRDELGTFITMSLGGDYPFVTPVTLTYGLNVGDSYPIVNRFDNPELPNTPYPANWSIQVTVIASPDAVSALEYTDHPSQVLSARDYKSKSIEILDPFQYFQVDGPFITVWSDFDFFLPTSASFANGSTAYTYDLIPCFTKLLITQGDRNDYYHFIYYLNGDVFFSWAYRADGVFMHLSSGIINGTYGGFVANEVVYPPETDNRTVTTVDFTTVTSSNDRSISTETPSSFILLPYPVVFAILALPVIISSRKILKWASKTS